MAMKVSQQNDDDNDTYCSIYVWFVAYSQTEDSLLLIQVVGVPSLAAGVRVCGIIVLARLP